MYRTTVLSYDKSIAYQWFLFFVWNLFERGRNKAGKIRRGHQFDLGDKRLSYPDFQPPQWRVRMGPGQNGSEWGHTNAFFHSPLAIGVRAVILQLA